MTGHARLRTAAIGLGALLAVVGVQAQSPSGGASSALTDRDRADIRELVARYARALGSCAADDYASLFTPDGTFTSDDFRGAKHRQMYGQKATLRGRDQLRELVRTEEFCLDGKPRAAGSRPAPTVTLQASPEGARGSAPIGTDGRYDDVYVKTAQGWRFKSRTVTMPSPAPSGTTSAVPAQPGAFFTTSDGVRLHYTDAGRGRAIVFIPGWTMSGGIWEPQLRAFSSRYRTITLDPRAQGASEMTGEGLYLGRRGRDVGELLDHLNLSDVVLVGWSMGVREVLTYVGASGTKRIAALALVEGNLWPQGPLEPTLENLRRMQADRKPFTRDFVKSMYVQPQTDAYIDRVTEMSLKTPTDAAAMLMFANAFGTDTDMRPLFGKIDRPVLFVGVPSKKPQGDTLRAAVPSARIEYVEGAGHALFVDQAATFNAMLEDFIRTQVPGTR
jgi:non-heme chloroperoxidase